MLTATAEQQQMILDQTWQLDAMLSHLEVFWIRSTQEAAQDGENMPPNVVQLFRQLLQRYITHTKLA
jgi:hypothetical protein